MQFDPQEFFNFVSTIANLTKDGECRTHGPSCNAERNRNCVPFNGIDTSAPLNLIIVMARKLTEEN